MDLVRLGKGADYTAREDMLTLPGAALLSGAVSPYHWRFIQGGRVHVMTESEFNDLVDHTFEALELALDEVDSDLDYEATGGVLTVEFDNGTVMVFSRQPPTRQLWLAARSGGFHFEFDEEAGDWRNTRSGELFRPFVVQQMHEQATVQFDWTPL